jgi:hypothetical protein
MTQLDSALVHYKNILTIHNYELKQFIKNTFGLLKVDLRSLAIDLNRMEQMNSSEDEVILRYIDGDDVYRVLYNQKKSVYFSELE